MAAFTFNTFGYQFQSRLGILRSSCSAAMEALNAGQQQARDDLSLYQGIVEGGGERIGEWDDDHNLIWDQADLLEYSVEVAGETLNALRKAFAISIYHHWERSTRLWVGSAKGKHDDLVKLALKIGLPIHPRLAAVRDLVNALKHDSKDSGNRLKLSWPDVLPPQFDPENGIWGWHDVIQLTDDHIAEVFSVISESGPNEKTLTWPA